MKTDDFLNLHSLERRRLFHLLTAPALAALLPRQALVDAANLLVGPREALAQAKPVAKYFIEISLRDQWDFIHFVVPPGVATHPGLVHGLEGNGEACSLFQRPNTLTAGPNQLFFTDQSKAMLAHADSLAVVQTVELCIGGIHGHEAVNGMRSPGRGYAQNDGFKPMWTADDPNQKDAAGDEFFYGSAPTPELVHLHHRRLLQPTSDRKGLALKFLGRSDKKHSVYYFPGDLSDTGFARVQSRQELEALFGPRPVASPPVAAADKEHLQAFLRLLDARHARELKIDAKGVQVHGLRQDSFLSRLGAAPKTVSLNLTDEEKAYWSSDVPAERSSAPKMHLWEQAALTFKLIEADAVSTVALEFCCEDMHGPRSSAAIADMGAQLGLVLARLISKLKAAGLYDDTAILVTSLDGGRSLRIDSDGSGGLNTFLLAGGRIQGGYYGDVKVTMTEGSRNTYAYHRPDAASGRPVDVGNTDNGGRVENAVAYRTILKAMGIPETFFDALPTVGQGPYLRSLIKT